MHFLENCKLVIEGLNKLAFRDPNKQLKYFTNAGDSVWYGIVTKTPPGDKNKAHTDKAHEPLAFHSRHPTTLNFDGRR